MLSVHPVSFKKAQFVSHVHQIKTKKKAGTSSSDSSVIVVSPEEMLPHVPVIFHLVLPATTSSSRNGLGGGRTGSALRNMRAAATLCACDQVVVVIFTVIIGCRDS